MFSLNERVFTTAEVASGKQIDASARLAAGTMHGMHDVVDLNINMVRATLQQTNFATRQLLSAKDLGEMVKLAGAQLEPSARRGFDYGYYLVAIAAGLQSQLIRFIGERMDDANGRLALLANTAGQAGASDASLIQSETKKNRRAAR